jgi:hypothetical protein
MKEFMLPVLLLYLLNKNIAQLSNATISINGTMVASTNVSVIEIPSESPSHSLTQASTFNETETFVPETEDSTLFPGEELTQSPGSQQRPQRVCRSIGILNKSDCQFACSGFSSAFQYHTSSLLNASGLIKRTFQGFRCQCLQAVTPVDCFYYYPFPACRDAGIANCLSEVFPAVSYERDDDNRNYTTVQTVNTSLSNSGNTELDANSTTVENVPNATTCGMYCRDLGFLETKDDLNDNDYNSLCTHNDLRDWTSCACGVVLSLDSGRSVSISDGTYVCGDDGFEEGLTFDATSSSSAKVFMGRHSQSLGIFGLIIGILGVVYL